jgi:hypothetical protein
MSSHCCADALQLDTNCVLFCSGPFNIGLYRTGKCFTRNSSAAHDQLIVKHGYMTSDIDGMKKYTANFINMSLNIVLLNEMQGKTTYDFTPPEDKENETGRKQEAALQTCILSRTFMSE